MTTKYIVFWGDMIISIYLEGVTGISRKNADYSKTKPLFPQL